MNKDNMLTEQENQHFNIKETKKKYYLYKCITEIVCKHLILNYFERQTSHK